jgi:hypothetical protein
VREISVREISVSVKCERENSVREISVSVSVREKTV